MNQTIKPLGRSTATESRRALTFTEGFNFGLGFWVAGFLFLVFGVPIFTILAFIVLVMLGASFGN